MVATGFLHQWAGLPYLGHSAGSSSVETQVPPSAGYPASTPVVLFLILFVRPTVSLFTLCTLFVEPRVGKVQAQRLGEM